MSLDKKQNYSQLFCNNYFWRTYRQKEIDFIEETEGKLNAYEIKWGKKLPRPPKTWSETYKNSTYSIINKENYLEFIS